MVSRVVVFTSMVFGMVFSLLSLILFVYLYIKYIILKSKTSVDIQNILKFYIIIEILTGFIVGFSMTHNCVVYRIENTVIYATPLLFWDAALQNTISILRQIMIITLGLDRIFIIILATTAHFKRQWYSFAIGISLMVIFSAIILIFRIIPNIPTTIFITSCVTFNCLGKLENSSLFLALRTGLGFFNFILGIILAVLLKQRFKVVSFFNMKNNNMMLVVLTLFMTIILDFLPNLFGFIFTLVSYIVNYIISL